MAKDLGVAADVEGPDAALPPVVDGGEPASGGSVLGMGFVGLEALDFQDQHAFVSEADEVVGLVGVGDALVLVRDGEAQALVAGVAGNGVTIGSKEILDAAWVGRR